MARLRPRPIVCTPPSASPDVRRRGPPSTTTTTQPYEQALLSLSRSPLVSRSITHSFASSRHYPTNRRTSVRASTNVVLNVTPDHRERVETFLKRDGRPARYVFSDVVHDCPNSYRPNLVPGFRFRWATDQFRFERRRIDFGSASKSSARGGRGHKIRYERNRKNVDFRPIWFVRERAAEARRIPNLKVFKQIAQIRLSNCRRFKRVRRVLAFSKL